MDETQKSSHQHTFIPQNPQQYTRPHKRPYNRLYCGQYICIDKCIYNGIVYCNDGGIEPSIGVCPCQT